MRGIFGQNPDGDDIEAERAGPSEDVPSPVPHPAEGTAEPGAPGGPEAEGEPAGGADAAGSFEGGEGVEPAGGAVWPSAPGPRTVRRRGLRRLGRVGAVALGGAVVGAVAVALALPAVRGAFAGSPSITTVNVPVAQMTSDSPGAAAYKTLAPSVVMVTNQQASQQTIFGSTSAATAWGSGVIFSSDGYIVTNDHVVQGATSITVTLSDGTTYPATLVGGDPSTDLAVIRIHPTSPLPAATFANSNDVVPGEAVVAIGNPLGPQDAFSVSQGIVSAVRPMLYGLNQSQPRVTSMLQTDAAINPGNSGGPLANMAGQVIGIVSIKTVSTGEAGVSASGLGFAIPSNVVAQVANELIQYGYYKWPYLGITFPSNVGNVLPSQQETLTISGVDAGGPSAGKLEAGDVVSTWNGKPVLNYYQLVGDVSGAQPGQTVTIGVLRGGQLKDVRITLGTETKAMALGAAPATSPQQPVTPVPGGSGTSPFPFPLPFPFGNGNNG